MTALPVSLSFHHYFLNNLLPNVSASTFLPSSYVPLHLFLVVTYFFKIESLHNAVKIESSHLTNVCACVCVFFK